MQTSDGLSLHTVSWLPEGTPRAAVLLVHGIGEHSGRYSHVAARLNAEGLAVYGLDHRGHGQSQGERCYFERFEAVLADLKQFADHIRTEQPGRKLFIYGHSLGALISLRFLQTYPGVADGAVLSGCPLAVETTQPKALIAAAQVLNALAPRLAISKPLPSSTLSRDEAVGRAYDADALVYHGSISVRMGYHIVMQSRAGVAALGALRLPLFVYHGAADEICPPPGSQMLYDGAAAADKTLKWWPEMRHECHNEIGKEAVLDAVAAWITARV